MASDIYRPHTSDEKRSEWARRVGQLIVVRGMSGRAARIVVDAAMFGIGCLEGTVRKQIEEESRGKENS